MGLFGAKADDEVEFELGRSAKRAMDFLICWLVWPAKLSRFETWMVFGAHKTFLSSATTAFAVVQI